MATRLLLTILLAGTPLAAQDYWPDLPRLEAMAAAAEAGDESPRDQLEREGRALFVWAAQHRVTGATAHLVARIGFIFGGPFAPPDSTVTRRELFWRSGLVRALHSALAADSGDLTAAAVLEHLEPYPHIWMDPDRELAHLRALVSRHTELPTALGLAYVGLELERGDPERAWVMLLMLDREAVGQVRWQHLDAQVRFARGQSYSAERYYVGAQFITTAAEAQVYRDDLEWIAEPEELAAFDALVPGDSTHTVWLRKFWTRRDLEDARLPGTRLREHFARWRIALRESRWDRFGSHALGLFSVPGLGIEYNWKDTKFPVGGWMSTASLANRHRSRSRVVDDRGALIVRHGPPQAEAILPGITGLGQVMVSWRVNGLPLVVSLSRPPRPDTNIPDVKWGFVARNMPVGDLTVGCQLDAQLCGLAGLVEAGGNTDIAANRTVERYTAMRETAESTDANPERFAKPLEAYVQAYGVAGGGVLVSYAIRARDLAGGAVKLRVVVGDVANGEIVAALDTVRRWTLPANTDALVSGWTLLSTPPGDWRVGVVLADTTGASGNGNAFDTIPAIPAVLASGLRLSDPILGRVNSGLRWTRMGHVVPLNPTGAWLRSEEATLSAELYGVIPGRNYRLSIELRDGNARQRLAITETLAADATMMFLQRNLSFANLDAGIYRLVMRITDAENGESVERERMVPVR